WQGTYSYIGLQLVSIGLLVEFILFMLLLNYVVKISGRWKLLIVPIVWTVFEYSRSIGYIGYPWGLIGTSQFSFTPFIQLASITGIWGISLLLLYSNSAITWIVQLILKNRQLKMEKKHLIFPLSILFLCIINILGGLISIHFIDENIDKTEDFKNIVVVQQNRDPRKHSYQQSLDFAMELTDLAIEELGYTPDLIVWPEGAFKPDIRWYLVKNRVKSHNKNLTDQLIDFVISKNTNLVTGTQDHIFLDEERRNFNSSALINPDGTINVIYHKIKLVPFTEHFPYKRQFPWMWEFLQKFDTSNWLAGTERKIMNIEGLKIFTPICFEDVFPDHIRRFVLDGGDLIANISNDYWSLSPIEGLQHGINGLFRSVENRRPMVRATCSGYTVAVDSAGRITDEVSGFYEKGYIIVKIPEMDYPLSVYTRFGDWLPMFLMVFLGIFIIYRIIIYYLLNVFKLHAINNSNFQ
ncbi:MAG: apolipoprotein N-acyltransferase, partial [Deltaproteobacteria bacterium]|nr:apolipoprotein N-acyltransferase [Deltaproteobacteria bacterium]